MTNNVYIDSILEPIMKALIVKDHDFALEKDGHFSYGTSKKNLMRKWKEKH